MIRKPGKSEKRSEQELRTHYEIEKELAEKLRNASKSERRTLYTDVYDELYRRVPNHPQLTQKFSRKDQQKAIKKQMKLLGKLLNKNHVFMEIGPGDCSLSFHVADTVKKVYAVDVSETITKSSYTPDNFNLLLSNGCDIPASANSVDFIYSNQLMEHLHPEDAFEQLKSIFTALVPGGTYLCITPNRINGPHDISKYFDTVATGFHLKEYSATELIKLFRKAGYTNLTLYAQLGGKIVKYPLFLANFIEWTLDRLPLRLKLSLTKIKLVKALMKIQLAGVKSS